MKRIALLLAIIPITVFAQYNEYIKPSIPFKNDAVFKNGMGQVDINTYRIPYLTWAADGILFATNNGAAKGVDTPLARALGKPVELVNGDDFTAQLKEYIAGRTPFLRGELGMILLAQEGLLQTSPELDPVVLVRYSRSTGADGIVGVKVNSPAEFKGKAIAVQFPGPHISFLATVLKDGNLSPSDVEFRYVKYVTPTPNSASDPATALRKDPTLAGAAVIITDLSVLTRNRKGGNGNEDSLANCKDIISTATADNVIFDVLCVRKDWFEQNRGTAEKLANLIWSEQDSQLAEINNIMSKGDKQRVQKFKQKVTPYAGAFMPDATDIAGYIMWLTNDSKLDNRAGNLEFFNNPKNAVGMLQTVQLIQDFYTTTGFITVKPKLNWANFSVSQGTGASRVQASVGLSKEKVREIVAQGGTKMLFTYTFQFPAEVSELNWREYKSVFDELHKNMSRYGGAVIQIRGHTDTTWLNIVKAKRSSGASTYERRNKATNQWETLPLPTVEETVNSINQLSEARAMAIKKAYATYLVEAVSLPASEINLSRIDVKGMGANDPVVAKPVTPQEKLSNMRSQIIILGIETELPVDVSADDIR